jgi:micrococcal nuclease
MKKLLIAAILSLSTSAYALDLPIRYVYDGDTIMVTLVSFPSPLNNASVRIKGIDSPELHGKCQAEIDLAIRARSHMKFLVSDTASLTLTNYSWDKYGGRIAADVFVKGKNLATEMINAGYARPYLSGARKSWCD